MFVGVSGWMRACTTAMAKIVKMIESLSEQLQQDVMEHLCEYIDEIEDEADWNKSFAKNQSKLVAAGKKARKDVQNGKSEPMNPTLV
jgi:uncharacterized protein Yka (UPF0111/DUF47 family)